MTHKTLQQLYGNIDIYLFDQLLKGRYDNCHKVLDAGCGNGRNLVYFLTNGFEVYGTDPAAQAIASVKTLAGQLASHIPAANFKQATIESMPFEAEYFDLIISSAVLHFATSQEHFHQMLTAMWSMLKPGGYFFARLASNIGIQDLVRNSGDGRYLLPDGTERYLVNMQQLLNYTDELNGHLYEPIKTTNVQNMRCMTTWCIQKP